MFKIITIFFLCISYVLCYDDDLLFPYPRSKFITGSKGPIYVLNENSIKNRADKVTIQTLSGVLARITPKIYIIHSSNITLTNNTVNIGKYIYYY